MGLVESDAVYAASALHVLLTGSMPGETVKEGEGVEEMRYAGELMVVQFFSLIRTMLVSKPKE